jgi:hypothetical protein
VRPLAPDHVRVTDAWMTVVRSYGSSPLQQQRLCTEALT